MSISKRHQEIEDQARGQAECVIDQGDDVDDRRENLAGNLSVIEPPLTDREWPIAWEIFESHVEGREPVLTWDFLS